MPAAHGLVDALLTRRLAVASEQGPQFGWTFVHAMLKESIRRRAREAGRAARHHRWCAEALAGGDAAETPERVGRHLLAAGEDEAALAPLLTAARRRLRAEGGDVEELLSLRDAAMARVGVPQTDSRWGEAWRIRSEAARRKGHVDESERWSTQLEAASRAHGWTGLLAPALIEQAMVLRLRGVDLDAGTRMLREAAVISERLDDRERLGLARRELGLIQHTRGDPTSSASWATMARHDFEACGAHEHAARAILHLAHVHAQSGDIVQAGRLLARARRRFVDAGCRWGVAFCANAAGEHARFAGRIADATASYREALRRYEAVGHDLLVPELNLGINLSEQGEFDEARERLERALHMALTHGRRPMILCTHVALLVVYAGLDQWQAFDDSLGEALAQAEATGFVNVDTALSARAGGEAALAAGEPDRAIGALGLALDQYTALVDDDGMREIRAILAAVKPA